MKTSVNILGCCVSRDVFGFQEDNGGYDIRQYLNWISPLLVFERRVPLNREKMEALDVSAVGPAWGKKCILHDMERTYLEYIKSKKSDYLIVDMANSRYDIVKFKDGSMGTYSNVYIIDMMSDHGVCPEIESIDGCDSISIEKIKEAIKNIANFIRQNYPVERVILLELKESFVFFDATSDSIYRYEDINTIYKHNKMMHFCFSLLKKELGGGVNIIYLPENIVCNRHHFWGNEPLHYTNEYYDYCFRAINLIINSDNIDNVNKCLEIMRNDCSDIYRKKYGLVEDHLSKFENKISKNKHFRKVKSVIYRRLYHCTKGRWRTFFDQKRKDLWKI